MTETALEQDCVIGVVERVTFFNEDNGFSILKIKVKNQAEPTTIVGELGAIAVGEYVSCQGQWVIDRKYGRQLKVSSIEIALPDSLMGIERYLSSGLLRGVGVHFAKKMVDQFGLKIFDIIENQPKKLLKIAGFGAQRLSMLKDSWQEQKLGREILVFLQTYGVALGKALRIYRTYGPETLAKVKANPYDLAFDVAGIGFKSADDLALRLGFAANSPERALAGIDHVLQNFCQEGHCAYPREALMTASMELLSLDREGVLAAMEEGILQGHWVAETIDETVCIYPRSLYLAEEGVAKEIARLNTGECPWVNDNGQDYLPWLQTQIKIELSASQEKAIACVLDHKLSVVTGGPGVGKTTIVNALLKLLYKARLSVCLCAPTGRAAKRMTETTGVPAKTIHRLLQIDPSTRTAVHHENEPLKADVVIIDESSMIDIALMYKLLRAIPTHAAVIWVGDSDQLPSVGPGAVLSDLIHSGCIASVQLTEIFRQAAHSQIILNAHRINQGLMPSAHGQKDADFYVIVKPNVEEIHQTLIDLVVERLPQHYGCSAVQDIQVLSPMNRGSLGTLILNQELQARLNGHARLKLSRLGIQYALGDKVIQTVNNYSKEVFNGDIGWIESINMDEQSLQINFDGCSVKYEQNELDEVNLAYAISIHKSQGSEFPRVVIPLAMQHYNLLVRNLLYTGITRGKQLVVLVVEEKALYKAVHNDKIKARVTKLAQRLRKYLPLI